MHFKRFVELQINFLGKKISQTFLFLLKDSQDNITSAISHSDASSTKNQPQ